VGAGGEGGVWGLVDGGLFGVGGRSSDFIRLIGLEAGQPFAGSLLDTMMAPCLRSCRSLSPVVPSYGTKHERGDVRSSKGKGAWKVTPVVAGSCGFGEMSGDSK